MHIKHLKWPTIGGLCLGEMFLRREKNKNQMNLFDFNHKKLNFEILLLFIKRGISKMEIFTIDKT